MPRSMNLLLAARLSELERRVTVLEARGTVFRDPFNRRVLALLKSFDESPFNRGPRDDAEKLSMTPELIGNGTGGGAKEIALALNELQRCGFVELLSVDSTGHWRITDDGRDALWST